jgi:4-hydroxybenzoate polyprenyltransferase
VSSRRRTAARGRRPSGIPVPKHPYRDSAVFHLVLGALLLVVAWLTGGDLAKALVVAVLYVVLAIGWSWYRFRQRLARQATEGADGTRG